MKKGVSQIVMIIIGVILTIFLLIAIAPLAQKAFRLLVGGT